MLSAGRVEIKEEAEPDWRAYTERKEVTDGESLACRSTLVKKVAREAGIDEVAGRGVERNVTHRVEYCI